MRALLKLFRKYVINNLPLKIVALLVAFLLWWSVARDQTVETLLSVPLELQHAPANLEINSELPFQARVTLRGPQHRLEQMNASEVHAVLDVGGASAGERTFDLSANDVRVPREVKVVQVVPTQFHILFARSITRTIAIKPRVLGTLLSGYSIAQVTAEPATVTISGPEQRVNAIDFAITDPVDASGVVGTATFSTHAYVADPLVHVSSPGPIHVTVTTEKTVGKAKQS